MSDYPVTLINYQNMSHCINFAQVICNINSVTHCNLNNFITECEDVDKELGIIEKCSDHILEYYDKNYIDLLNTSKLFVRFKKKINSHVLKGLKSVKMYDTVVAAKKQAINNHTVKLNSLNLSCYESENFVEPDLITYLNSLKFPKPRTVEDPVHTSTGRDLISVLRDISQAMDQQPNIKREELHDLSIFKATAKQKIKYKNRAVKSEASKKSFRENTDIVLNMMADNDNFAYMKIKIDKNSYNLLIDTGAMASFITKELVTGIIYPTDIKVSTAGSDASNKNVIGETYITFNITDINEQTYTMTHKFIVLCTANGFYGILGADIILEKPYSISMNFKNKYWEIKLENQNVKIPYIGKNVKGECLTTYPVKLKPKESKLITVQCVNLDRHFNSCYFENQGQTNDQYDVIPSLNNVELDNDNILSTQIIVSNKTTSIVEIPQNKLLHYIKPSVDKSAKDIVVDKESFDEALKTKSLHNVLVSYCVTKYGDSFNKDDVEYCANKTDNDTSYVLNNIKVLSPNLSDVLSPNLSNFNNYAAALDKGAESLERNVKFSDETVDITHGYKNNLENIESSNPDLVLEDDFLGYVNKNHTTDIGDSDKLIEEFSYKDVDLSHIPSNVRHHYDALLKKYEHIFSTHSWDIGHTDLLTVKLEVDKPQKSQKQRQIPHSKMEFVDQAVRELLSAGVIKKAKAWTACSNLILVPKYKNVRYSTKAETLRVDPTQIRAYRICVDLRNLNEVLSLKCSSLSKPPEKIIMPLAHRMVTNLDVCQAYFSIPLHEDSKAMTSFFVENNVYCFNRLSQGLLPSPRAYEYFNELTYVDTILGDAHKSAINLNNYDMPDHWSDIVELYQDDSWLHSKMDYAHHLYFLSLQFYAIARGGVKLSPKKCKIAVTNVKVLGLEVDTQNAHLAMDMLKASSIISWPDPTSLYEVHSRLYSLLYYAKFLPKIKELSLPLIELLRDKTFEWSTVHKTAWENIKALIILDIRLTIPGKDDQLYLFTDASKISCSSVLFADVQGSLKVVCTDSTLFNYSDSLKSAFVKESIGLIRGLKKFANYIGSSNTRLRIFTDCRALLFVSRKREHDIASFNISTTLLHYQSIYGFDIYHIKGLCNVYADLNSRAFEQSRFIRNNEYALSKEQSAILPPLTSPFVIDGDVLYEFFTNQPSPERWDTFKKDRPRVSVPRPLTNLAKLYDSCTPEEKHVAAIRLLEQWNDTALTRIDYTNQLNKKLGVSLNNLSITSDGVFCIDHPTMICCHPDLNTNGEIMASYDINIAPDKSFILSRNLQLQTNTHVKVESCVKDLQVFLHPIQLHEYQIMLINTSERFVRIKPLDIIARLVSNITIHLCLLDCTNFESFKYIKYVLPESGITITEPSTEYDALMAPINKDAAGCCVSFNNLSTKNEIDNNNSEDDLLFKKSHIATEMILHNAISLETMINLQREDKYCSTLLDNFDPEGPFILDKGVLCKVIKEHNYEKKITVIPKCLIHEVLQMIHVGYGHPSRSSFLKIFTANYYYPAVKKLILNIISSCVLCAKAHTRPNFKIHRGHKRSYTPPAPRFSISLDIIPKLNTTSEGNSEILLILDNYSRYCSAILMRSKSESSILNALKNYFMQQAVPTHIFSDSESSIISACKKLMRYFDFYLQTSPAESQHKNRTENAFKDIKSLITRVLYDPENKLKSVDWDIGLVYALHIINTMPLNNSKLLTREYIHFNNVTKCMPLLYSEDFDLSPSDVNKILDKQNIAKLEKYKSQDKHINIPEFKPNTIVYVKCQPDPTVKNTFAMNTKGPFKILTVDNLTKTLQCRLMGSKKLYTVAFENVNKIPLTDVNLSLFQGFLQNPEKRDFNTRPREKVPDVPLHQKKEEVLVRRSSRLLKNQSDNN